MRRTKPPYPPEFRREAVESVVAGWSVRNVVAGRTSDQSLHNWSSSTSWTVENATMG